MKHKESNIEILEKEGWTQRFIADEPRLSEAVDLYRDSGFEVHLEPLPEKMDCETCIGDEEPEECRVCFEGNEDKYMIIFTRPLDMHAEVE
jgi:hypothetical protein